MMVETIVAPVCAPMEPRSSQPGAAAHEYPAEPMLSVALFGGMRARDANGNDVLPRLRKTRAVLAVLAHMAPQPMLRSHLIRLLWSRPGRPEALGSLRQALLELKAALGPAAGLLRIERRHIALRAEGLHVDTRQNLEPGHGALLPDLEGISAAFDRWLNAQRSSLAQRVLREAEAMLTDASEPGAAEAAAHRLLAIDVTHERAWRALIHAHAARGDRRAALAAFERCRTALFQHCRLDPSPETAALLADLQTATPRAPSPGLVAASLSPQRRRARASIRLDVATLRSVPVEGTLELAVALTEELILALSRFRWLGSGLCPTGQPRSDSDFLLDGVVRRNGDRLRVLLSLVDVRSGSRIVWTERFDYDVRDIPNLHDWLASTVAARIEPRLWHWQAVRIAELDPAPRTTHDLVRLAIPEVYRHNRRGFMIAGQRLNRAVELEPEDVVAHVWAVQWHLHCVGQGWTNNAPATIERAAHLAERAIRLDPEDARALTLAGHVQAFLYRRHDEALRLHERAIAANPNLPLAWAYSSIACSYVGNFDEGIRRVRHAQSLSPHDPHSFFYENALCASQLMRGEYAAAAAAGHRAIALNPGYSSAHKGYLAAVGHLGDEAAAVSSRRKLMELERGFSVAEALRRSPFSTTESRELFAEGLRAAGVQ